MSTPVTVLIAALNGTGIDGSVDDLVDAAAGSRSMLIDARTPLVARLHEQSADFAATTSLQLLDRAVARFDRGLPVVPREAKSEWWRGAHS